VVATFGVLVAAVYWLWNYQQVFHGDADEANEQMPDLTIRERLVVAPLIVLIVVLGVYPKFMLDRIEPSVARTVATVVHASPTPASHVVIPSSTRLGGDR
jgi:NADH-quinone oxidoreductase subunit M